MCMYLTYGNFLGQRLIGFDIYDSKSKGFIGMTEKQIINKLKSGERVYGFILGMEDDKEVLKLDAEGFNMRNLQIKTGVNNLSWMNEEESTDMNIGLIVVKVSGDKKKVYETVNARHARVEYSEDKLKMMLELGIVVAGVKLEKNKLVACEGVAVTGSGEEVKEGLIYGLPYIYNSSYNDNYFIMWDCLFGQAMCSFHQMVCQGHLEGIGGRRKEQLKSWKCTHKNRKIKILSGDTLDRIF